jgi:TolA-binding protein
MAYNIHIDGKANPDDFLQTALALGELVLSENKLYDAQTIFTKACEAAISGKNPKAGAFGAFGLGKVFIAQRKNEKAREQFEIARQYFMENDMTDRLSMVEKELRLISL